jgi:hypothetical protein
VRVFYLFLNFLLTYLYVRYTIITQHIYVDFYFGKGGKDMKFKKAILRMVEEGEFERIINYAKGKDKKRAIEFYNFIKTPGILATTPTIALLQIIESQSVLKDIICYMEHQK